MAILSPRICPTCGNEYQPTSPIQIFCKPSHRHAYSGPRKGQLPLLVDTPEGPEPEPRMISVSWFPEAVKQSGMAKAEIAQRAGWGRSTAHVNRILETQRCRYETAIKLLKALDLTPIDVGL